MTHQRLLPISALLVVGSLCLASCGDDGGGGGAGGTGGASGTGGNPSTGGGSGDGGAPGSGGGSGAGGSSTAQGTSSTDAGGTNSAVVASSAEATASSSSGGSAEPPDMEGMTAAHNAARASVDPAPASPIPPLEWDPAIYATAQAYAEGCVFEHSGNGYGENLFASAGQSPGPADVVASWVSEAENYDYDANSCSGTCGHYTQVVWADSLHLGCGHATCTQNSPFQGFDTWDIWVCNYDPPGNFNGQRPY